MANALQKAVMLDRRRSSVEEYADVLQRLRSYRPVDTAQINWRDGFGAELIQLAQAVIRREVEFRRLFELIDTVQRGVTAEEVLGRVYDSFSDLIPYDRIGCAFLSPDGSTLIAHWARSSLGPVRLSGGYAQSMAGSSLQTILDSGEPRIINDLEDYLAFKPNSHSTRRIVEEGGRSSLTCPLVAEGRPIGFLFFTSRERNAYRDLHPEIFRQIANQLSLVIEKSRTFEKIQRAAHYDSLTELPNRTMFFETLAARLAAASEAESVAVHYLDLDHFKHVNDTLGHPVGDRLLRNAARRLARCVGERGMVARLGGDEFAIVQHSVLDRVEAIELARDVIKAVQPPFRLEGRDVLVGVSIGIALAEESGQSADDLLKMADIALYEVKKGGRGAFRLFEPRMDERFREKIDLERDLRLAIAKGELEIHYQPILALNGARVVACEALARWLHPTRGSISPTVFIAIAEEAGLIGALGEWVLRRACAQAATWPPDVMVAVNVSARQFENPAFAAVVRESLEASGLTPERLEIELTESTFLHTSDDNLAALKEIADLGVSLALDDFGTGFSSLSYLHRFRFSRLKIDRSFIANLPHCSEATAIVRSVAQLARALDMRVTAEGVETAEQLRQVRRLGCSEMQGYLLTAPRRPEDLAPLFRAGAAAATDFIEQEDLAPLTGAAS
ncbi:MAG: EAL domain-containing protein [Rhodoblastus sp.]